MNTMIADRTGTADQASRVAAERPGIARRPAEPARGIEPDRMPLAAGLLPYGLSPASLLRS